MFGGGVRRPAPPAPRVRLGVEELTPRVLPSAGCGMAAAGAASFAARFTAASSSSDDDSSSGSHDCGGHFGDHHHGAELAALVATLSDSAGATGTAAFNTSSDTLFVSVKGATPSTTLNVTVTDNGTTTTVGTVTTDASGNGHARITDVTAAAGDTVAVGDVTGTLNQVKFTATLSGTTAGVSGSARYNSVRNSLQVFVSGAAASTTYNVSVNGTVVGQITTDARGRGHLRVTPPSGVTIASGSTISIADTGGDPAILTGTFA
jgi:hypothetical protein